MRRLTLLLICFCLTAGLSACGQKGPLVPPSDDINQAEQPTEQDI